ncbi:MAG: type I-E CRISPR-associated protein Cas5/CasD [Propionibacteriaceae bacterium]
MLVLRLAGPLQSWGARSRFTRRMTEAMPTKSGILGLLAAAQGLRREDPVESLLGLRLAVRTEQQGSLLRDFHTAHHQVSGESMPLSQRYYWADAVFTAYIEGPNELIQGLDEALSDPAYPLYLGRRSCVPEGRISLGVKYEPLAKVVASTPWQANAMTQRRCKTPMETLEVQADEGVFLGVESVRQLQDVPLSFDPVRREYAVRAVVDTTVDVPNPRFEDIVELEHDPMMLAEESA